MGCGAEWRRGGEERWEENAMNSGEEKKTRKSGAKGME